jgi:CheY-like chemotaxis protein
VILGNAEAMTNAAADPVWAKTMAEVTAKAAERGAELTNRLLAFGRRQPLEPGRVDLNTLLRDSEGLLRRTIIEDVEIEVVRGAGLWSADLDAGQLEVALINLVLNASDALPEGGRITIETANSHLSEDYVQAHANLKAGQYVPVSVSDNGIGMDADTVARATEPFFTTKETGKGSGLGLSMVFGFVKQSGEYLSIYSESGEGTTVRLYFPRAGAQVVETETIKELDGMQGGRKHVLVAEDDDLVRSHLATRLTSLGYRVTEAVDGPDALAQMARLDAVDLLLADIVMPGGLNGRGPAERAVAMKPALRVLYTSGDTENAIVHQGRLDPGVDLLSKLYRRKTLADKVRLVLDRP